MKHSCGILSSVGLGLTCDELHPHFTGFGITLACYQAHLRGLCNDPLKDFGIPPIRVLISLPPRRHPSVMLDQCGESDCTATTLHVCDKRRVVFPSSFVITRIDSCLVRRRLRRLRWLRLLRSSVRVAKISHSAPRERDRDAVVRLRSRRKYARLSRKQKTTARLPLRCSALYFSSSGLTSV